MLDKSVPFVDFVMHRPSGLTAERHTLPKGYRFVLFEQGDEVAWAEVETSVGEFDSEVQALMYFQDYRLPYLAELERRCLFIENSKGKKVATATAWWNYTGERREAWLHWVAVRPRYQGKGLGKAIVGEALDLIGRVEGDRDIYLHTQTWSHKAVGIYEKAGFRITDERNLGGYENKYVDEAVTILKKIKKKSAKR